jgi:hypothetical protein
MRTRIIALSMFATFVVCSVSRAQEQQTPDRPFTFKQLVALRDQNVHLLEFWWVYAIGVDNIGLRVYIDKDVRLPQAMDVTLLPWRGDRVIAVRRLPIAISEIRATGAMMGSSTSNAGGCFTGTLGFTALSDDGKKTFGYVTNNHVAAADKNRYCPNSENSERQVSPATGMNNCSDGLTIGRLDQTAIIPIKFTYDPKNPVPNDVDAAFVSERGIGVSPVNRCNIAWSATTITPDDVYAHTVQKCGARTNLTMGTVVDKAAIAKVRYHCGFLAYFRDQIAVRSSSQLFSDFGDSGSLVVTDDEKVVGIVFATGKDGAGKDQTFVNPIEKVLTSLNVRLCPRLPCQ